MTEIDTLRAALTKARDALTAIATVTDDSRGPFGLCTSLDPEDVEAIAVLSAQGVEAINALSVSAYQPMTACKDIPDALVIRLAAAWKDEHPSRPGVVAALQEMGFPVQVADAKVQRLIDRGLLEYGTSPMFAWPTIKGLAALPSQEA